MNMGKTTVRSIVKLSETDRNFLEVLGKFCVRARHSNWENVTHTNDIEAIGFLKEMSSVLTTSEYQGLMSGWGDIRISGDDNLLNSTVDIITRRLQERSETF